MITTSTKSKFLTRLENHLRGSGYRQVGTTDLGYWIGNTRVPTAVETTLLDLTFYEESYKGYQLVIVGWHRQTCDVFDVHGQPFASRSNHQLEESMVAFKSEPKIDSTYEAYAWKIDHPTADIPNLAWAFQFASIKGVFLTTDLNKTLVKAKKKVDLLDSIQQILPELIDISHEKFKATSTSIRDLAVYNAVVGDQVFIQAHGRLRKGIVVGTTGSRFIVGYVTPSNHQELKYKTLHVYDMYTQGNSSKGNP